MGIGNHPISTMNKLESKKHVCFWFDLGGSSDQKGKSKYKQYKRKLTQDLIYEILRPVREAQARGGIRFEHDGAVVHAYPVLALVISDTPQRQSLAAVYGSAAAQFPCSMCKLPGELFPDGQAGMQQPLRTTAETNETRVACLQARNKQAKLKEHSRAFRCLLLLFVAFRCFLLLHPALSCVLSLAFCCVSLLFVASPCIVVCSFVCSAPRRVRVSGC
jgi:hypothetical protein